MKSFYTSVELIRNRICYRGYNENGHPIQHRYEFEPSLFLPSNKETGWKSLEGDHLAPKKFGSPSDMWNWVNEHEELTGFKYYGMEKPVTQFIQDKFPGDIAYNAKWINVVDLDIEVHSEEGFPHADEANYPVTCITAKSSRSGVYHTWSTKLWEKSKSEHKHLDIKFTLCEHEEDLLKQFVSWWRADYPDVITGYNVRFFDMPYIINRLNRLGFEEAALSLSPWGKITAKQVQFKNKNMDGYVISGISIMDYYDLFQKFGYTYGPQESYKLDRIAEVVLGKKKMSYEEYGSLKNLWLENPQLYIDYNIRDVELVELMNQKDQLIELGFILAYYAGSNFADVFGTTAIWDSIVYRKLTDKFQVPPRMKPRAQIANQFANFAGGYVKNIIPGMYKNVVSFDLASLYPNIIAGWNMSPEKLFIDPDKIYMRDPEWYLGNSPRPPTGLGVAGNGVTFKNDGQGIFGEIVVDLYNDRKGFKRTMLDSESEYQTNPTKGLERLISELGNKQQAIKIMLNSLFGAIGNKWYRYFDLRIAEGITLTGQMVIKWCEKAINGELNKLLSTEDVDYVIAIDTDSLYVNFDPLVEKFKPENSINFIDELCKNHFNEFFKQSMYELHVNSNSFENRMEMEREVIADRAIWKAKKCYILNVWNKEGVSYDKPKLKIMGIEAIKSSTPAVCRDWMKALFPILMKGSEQEVQEYIADVRSKFYEVEPHDIAFPRGASDLDKWMDPNGIYLKGCPIHVRAALLYNNQVKKLGLEADHEMMHNGVKLKYLYLKNPNKINENVIGFHNYLPKEFDLHEAVDHKKMFDKTFLDPIISILDAVGWKAEKKQDLTDMFVF